MITALAFTPLMMGSVTYLEVIVYIWFSGTSYIAIKYFAAQRTNSCFPLMAPDEHYGLFGACYGHECWKFSDSSRLFYTVRKPG